MLDDLDHLFDANTFTLLVGPNGAGKTTLLRLLATISTPSSGRVHWTRPDGAEIQDTVEVRKDLGFVAHQPLVYDDLTPFENVHALLRLRGGRDPEAAERTRAWIERFGLTTRLHEPTDTLSRGQRQRLALAQAFAPEPRLLLLDEPASNLDAAGLDVLLACLADVKGRSTIILSTHEPDPFRPLADRTLEVRAGKLHEWGGHP